MITDNWGIIIVTYKVNQNELNEKIRKYSNLTKNIVVVNNDDSDINIDKSFVVDFKENRGIAAAHNAGAKFLRDKKVEHFFIFDQDTNVDSEYFSKMINLWNSLYNTDKKIGILSPAIVDKNFNVKSLPFKISDNRKRIIKIVDKSEEYFSNTLPIASGILVSTYAFIESGYENETFFIDWVDFDFDIRIIETGYTIYTSNRIEIKHSIGKKQKKKFLSKTIYPTNSQVFREYFFFRNGIFMKKKYKDEFPGIVKYVNRSFRIRKLFVFYEKDKIKRTKKILKGIMDGYRNPYPLE